MSSLIGKVSTFICILCVLHFIETRSLSFNPDIHQTTEDYKGKLFDAMATVYKILKQHVPLAANDYPANESHTEKFLKQLIPHSKQNFEFLSEILEELDGNSNTTEENKVKNPDVPNHSTVKPEIFKNGKAVNKYKKSVQPLEEKYVVLGSEKKNPILEPFITSRPVLDTEHIATHQARQIIKLSNRSQFLFRTKNIIVHPKRLKKINLKTKKTPFNGHTKTRRNHEANQTRNALKHLKTKRIHKTNYLKHDKALKQVGNMNNIKSEQSKAILKTNDVDFSAVLKDELIFKPEKENSLPNHRTLVAKVDDYDKLYRIGAPQDTNKFATTEHIENKIKIINTLPTNPDIMEGAFNDTNMEYDQTTFSAKEILGEHFMRFSEPPTRSREERAQKNELVTDNETEYSSEIYGIMDRIKDFYDVSMSQPAITIIILSIAGLLIIVIAAMFICRRHRREHEDADYSVLPSRDNHSNVSDNSPSFRKKRSKNSNISYSKNKSGPLGRYPTCTMSTLQEEPAVFSVGSDSDFSSVEANNDYDERPRMERNAASLNVEDYVDKRNEYDLSSKEMFRKPKNSSKRLTALLRKSEMRHGKTPYTHAGRSSIQSHVFQSHGRNGSLKSLLSSMEVSESEKSYRSLRIPRADIPKHIRHDLNKSNKYNDLSNSASRRRLTTDNNVDGAQMDEEDDPENPFGDSYHEQSSE